MSRPKKINITEEKLIFILKKHTWQTLDMNRFNYSVRMEGIRRSAKKILEELKA
ncbi:MAG: hypothetical protein ACFFG0_03710 [Candidatus Thorarchaeota archaeon]